MNKQWRRGLVAAGLIAAGVGCIVSTAVEAADYQYFNGRTNKHWRTDLLAWLAKDKPDPTTVSIGITPDGDVHAYAVVGQFTGIYTIQRFHHPLDRASTGFRAIVDGGTGKIIGFRVRAKNGQAREDSPPGPGQAEPEPVQSGGPPKFDVYILTWTKQ